MAHKINLVQTIASNPSPARGQSCRLNTSPDGSKIIYPSGSNIIIRDINDPSQSQVMAEHGKKTTVAKYSPNGQWIASADETGKIKIWSPEQDDQLVYKMKYEWHYLAGEIKDLAWCGDGKRIVVAGDGQGQCANAFIFDTGSKQGDFVGIAKRLNSCDIRPVKPFKTIVGGDDFNSVFYDGFPVKFVKTNKNFNQYVTCTRFNHQGTKYAASSANGSIWVYDGETGDNGVELNGSHKGGCYAISWSSDDSKLVSCSADKTVKVWDISSGDCVSTTTVGDQLPDQQLGVVWSPSGQIISVSLDGTLNYIDEASQTVSRKVFGHVNSISTVARQSDGSYLAGSGYTGDTFSYSTNFDNVTKLTNCHNAMITGIHTRGPEEHGFLTIAVDNTIKFGQADYTAEEDALEINSALGRPETSDSINNHTIIACYEGLVLLKGKEIISEKKLPFKPTSVAINQNLLVVVSGDGTETVKAFDCSNGDFADGPPVKINGGANAMKFNNAGTLLAVGDNQDKAIRLLEVGNNFKAKISNFPHSSKIMKMSWSPDDKYVVSSELSQNMAAWNTSAGKRKVLVKHAHRMGYVKDFTWAENDKMVTVGNDSLIKIWDVSF